MGLKPMSCRHRSIIITVVMIGLSLSPVFLDAAQKGGKLEVLPMTTAAPEVVVIETVGSESGLRKQMRDKNKVAELGVPNALFSRAPTGSFGFIAPHLLGIALVTQSPDLMLERMAPVANAYEIHKLADGDGLLLGFVSKELIPQITPADRPKSIRINLYSASSEKAPYIAAVPLSKLMVDRMPIKLQPTKADGPVMFDMDLQGTANRKSVTRTQ